MPRWGWATSAIAWRAASVIEAWHRPQGTDSWQKTVSLRGYPTLQWTRDKGPEAIAKSTTSDKIGAYRGRADDLLTNTLLTARCPVVLAPAMHTEMWEHPATQENVATLRRRGAVVIEPASGRLTGADTGKGRLPEPAALFEVCRRVLARGPRPAADLAGRRLVISAGGTREPLDPVRYLGNRSSGKQGYALARTAVARGASVTLVAANSTLPDPAGAEVIAVSTTEELRQAVTKAAATADAVVMAAAVADFRPAVRAPGKIKKQDGRDPEPIALVRNPDILAELSAERAVAGQLVIGFAAETDDVLANGRAKLARKGCDLLVVNEVGEHRAFGTEENEAVILDARGGETHVPYGPKDDLADRLWDTVAARWPAP
jgi:phosphopantothenoylcysteine decarboxylase / phosphopantothenate---cysteine ligase